jgi:dolichyl-diphosphooligosaccharide--protein glycosyltransferase
MMFLMLAFKSSRQNELSFSSLKNRAWSNLKKPLIYSLLAGIALGCYLLSWEGGALFVFIIFTFAVVQYIIDHLRGRSTDYLWIVGVPALLIALFIILPSLGQYSLVDLQIASLLIAILAFLVLGVLSFLMVNKNVNRFTTH